MRTEPETGMERDQRSARVSCELVHFLDICEHLIRASSLSFVRVCAHVTLKA